MEKGSRKKTSSKWIVISLIVFGVVFLFLVSTIAAITGTGGSGNTAHIKIGKQFSRKNIPDRSFFLNSNL